MNIDKIVRFEPYFNEWIMMEEDSEIYSIEFDDSFDPQKENIRLVKPEYNIENACSVPIVVQILLTEHCSYKCPHCHVWDDKSTKKELTTEEVMRIIDYCAEKGVLCIRFSGGEATLRGDFPILVKYTKKKGMQCAMLSNCRHFSQEVLDILPELSYIQTHLDSVNERTFNELTGGNNFKSFIKTLNILLKMNVNVKAATTLQKSNLDEISEIIEFCGKHHLPMRIYAVYETGEKYNMEAWNRYNEDVIIPFRTKWHDYQETAKKNNITLNSFTEKVEFESEVKDPMSVICSWGRSFMVINCEGVIYPFSFIMNNDLILGNWRKGDDIIDVWRNSPFLKKLRGYTLDAIGCGNCRIDCVYANNFFTYSYLGEFGKVLPHSDCINRTF